MSEDSGEKTFDPTAKRLRDAALKGDVLRSREVATAVSILAGAAWLHFAGPWIVGRLAQALRAGFTFDAAAMADFAPGRALGHALWLGLPPILLLALPLMILATASQLAFGEGRFVGANLAPKGSRINPLSGLKRMFGMTGLIEIAKGIAKVGLLWAIAWYWAAGRQGELLALGRGDLASDLAAGWDAIVSLLFMLAGGLVVIALIDWSVLWFRRNQRLRMSQQEMRDEHKEAEGSPENKAAQRQRQRQLAMGGLHHAMKDTQFVVTNPTHFSIAMAYDPARASAPIVLAKGRGEKALAMRELARELDVPLLEYPVLARSLYFTTRERQMIREELYAAVASVLAFVLSLKRGEHRPAPVIAVPVALRFDADGRAAPLAKA